MTGRILVIDDFFGRSVAGIGNPERENLCAHFLWRDITGDHAAKASRQKVLRPTADVIFARGQTPAVTTVGSVVENDLPGTMALVRQGWKEAMEAGEAPWAMVLLDLCFYTGVVSERSHGRSAGMPEGRSGDDDPRSYFGLTVLQAINREFPELPVFILSSKPREEVSLEFSRLGALGFIARDDVRGPDLLRAALWQHGLLADPAKEIVGNSLTLLVALREARRAASHRQNLLIRGERGCGKELLAAYVHRAGSDGESSNAGPFVAVNSAVLGTDLSSSEMFGIESKTASGVDGKIGLVEAADGGDLFLDEIADMPLESQAILLRVLQDKQVTRIGGRKPKVVDVRFLSATNVDLEGDPRRFRQDLLDRLRLGGTLWLPPLRERRKDIGALAEKFIRDAEQLRVGALRRDLTAEALARLMEYDWPGNIRELRSCLFDAVNRHPDVEHLVPGHLRIGDSASVRALPAVQQYQLPPPADEIRGPSLDGELGNLLEFQGKVRFLQDDIALWSGRLADLQASQARVLARYLEAALVATKRRSPEYPEGRIQIHPAVKLMTGNSGLTASKSADVIKRLLGPLESELDGDLREALATATRLRPRGSKPTNAQD